VPWGAEFPSAKNEKLIVEASEDRPHDGDEKRPDDEEGLEVEMEQHARTSNCRVHAHIGVNGIRAALNFASVPGLQDLGARPESSGSCHLIIVGGLSATEINDPHEEKEHNGSDDNE
jgi:hypothetical protein